MNPPSDPAASAADPRAATASLITACWSTQVIHVAVRLGVPDALAQGAGLQPMAQAAGVQPRALFRLLRALAALGLCRHVGAERFELTDSGQYLRGDVAGSLRSVALHWGVRAWPGFGHLETALRTGVAWNHDGREGFRSMAQRPEEAAVLNRSMAQQTLAVARAIVEAYDFSRFRSVTDLGGGYGALLATLLKAYPRMRGASADLAYLETQALAFLRDEGVGERAGFIATDFFRSVAPGADCYLLKFIIHDWGDADAVEILRNTRTATQGRAAVVLVEQLAPERVEAIPEHATIIRGDIHMMAATGGLERTVEEYRDLLGRAGLTLVRVVPTASTFSLIEAACAD